MTKLKAFTAEKLVIGILISDLTLQKALEILLQDLWGRIDKSSEPEEFTSTDYYTKEMGSPLYRIFYSFETLVNPENLADIKLRSNEVEQEFRGDSGRLINLDPGILCQSKFILATTKNNAHRIPLRQGIYGEITLQYRQGAFQDLEWTYPDYRLKRTKDFLLEVRQIYTKQLKAENI